MLFQTPIDLNKLELKNARVHVLASAPGTPVTGQLYYDSALNKMYYYNGATWVDTTGGSVPDATTGVKGIVQLAGDLAGTAALPVVAALAITDAKVAAANKDGVVGTASMRTLGAGSQQAMPGNRTLDAITVPAGPVAMNAFKMTGLADPTLPQDSATKAYVDLVTQGLDAKASVRVLYTTNQALTGAAAVNGGVTPANGERVLLNGQTAPAENGIWVVNTAGAWTRATDADTWAELVSAFVFVEQGTSADNGYTCTVDPGGTLNTTAVTFVQFSGAGQVIDGLGLVKTGNTLDVQVDASSIEINADILRVKALGVTNAMLAGLIDVTAKITGAVPLANGGTGQITAKTGRETGLGAAGYYSSATHAAGTTISITQATHGLRASRGILVQVQLESDGSVQMADVNVAANGDVTVTFALSQTLNTIRVTLIG